MDKITIIYSSWGGNTTLVVKKVAEILKENAFDVELINALVATPDDLTKTKYMILAAPTYDHGIIHEPFDRLLLKSSEIDLQWVNYAVIWLGDSKYDQEYTVESAPILETFITDHKGKLIVSALKINKSPIPYLDSIITSRTTNLLQTIQHG